MGKAKNALSDLDRVLELKPDFTAARITRGNVHLKMGSYDLAQLDFYNVVCLHCQAIPHCYLDRNSEILQSVQLKSVRSLNLVLITAKNRSIQSRGE